VEQVAEKKPKSIEEYLRLKFKNILDAIGQFLHSLGIHPNTVTIAGLVGNFGGAYLLATGHIFAGGIVVLLMGPIDALDGALARIRDEPGKFGAFVDSVTDRYSELIILGGLLVYYLQKADGLACFAIYLAAAGSVLVSYVKARAEALGFDAKVGILTRVERYIVLAPALVLQYPLWGVWIIAVLANFTALQRIWFVRKQAYALIKKKL
jgi:CDP-diacylglycerol--glycerol-3-phosphate 3-phosphatidyltransferase